jgi:cell division septal protein FtsQ
MADSNLKQFDLFDQQPNPAEKRHTANVPRVDKTATDRSKPKKATGGESGDTETKAPAARFNLKFRYVVMMMVLALAVSIWSWNANRMTIIQKVTVNDHYFTEEAEIIARSGITIGIDADSINPVAVIRAVEKLPYVRRAELVSLPPSSYLIRVEERRPIGLIKRSDMIRYVDKDGVLLPLVEGKALEVPLLYGLSINNTTDTLRSDAFKAMGAFLEALDRYDMAKITISDVAWEANTGIVAATGDYGTRLIFGLDGYEAKLRTWQAFYAQVVPKAGLEAFARIDFRYDGQVVSLRNPS